LRYLHQDHLTGTSVTTDANGNAVAAVKFFPFGGTRSTSGTLDTDPPEADSQARERVAF